MAGKEIDSILAGESHTAPVADLASASRTDAQAPLAFAPVDKEDLREEAEPDSDRGLSKTSLYRKRFFRNKPAVGGVAVLFLLIIFSVVGPLVSQWNYIDADFLSLTQPPSGNHWFGTNEVGNDLFTQTAHGLGRSLTIALSVSLVTTLISAIIGATAAYLGGRAEKAILAVIHFLLIVPSFLILALVVSNAGGDWKILILALIAFGWMYYSRVIWSLAISIREREYVQAARFMGIRGHVTIIRHIVPNIGSLLIINFTLGVVSTIMSETGLSFLGLGVKIPDVSLGTLLEAGVRTLESSPWQFYFPATALTLLTVSMALIADGLRDALDPNSAAGGKA